MTAINETTALVKPAKDSEPLVYPVYMYQVRQENPQWSFSEQPDEELLNTLGYFVVQPTTPPTDGIVTEGEPTLANGVWSQTWVTRQPTADEVAAALAAKKQTMLADVQTKIDAALLKGYPFTFTEGVGHVQLRDGDRANLAGARVRAEALKAAGTTDAVMPFRDFENVTHMCTPDTIISLSDKAYDDYLTYLGTGWQIKDAIVAAKTDADLPTVPDEITLPAATS